MTDAQKIADILKRRKYFDLHFPPIERCDARQDIAFRLSNSCPSCGYLTLDERCSWDTCSFCFWEDDGQDNHDADKVLGGPNGDYSLTAHRLELYDWMTALKENKTSVSSTEKLLAEELTYLDGYISINETNGQLVLKQIEVVAELFDQFRNIGSHYKPAWKFLTENQIVTIKPALDY